jgi:hypothetical protein
MVCLLTILKTPSYGGSLVTAKKQTDRGNSSTAGIMLIYFPQKYYFNISCLLPRGLLRWIICRLWSKRLWCHGRPRGPCYRPVDWLETEVGWWRFHESRRNHDTSYRIVCCVLLQYHYVLFSVSNSVRVGSVVAKVTRWGLAVREIVVRFLAGTRALLQGFQTNSVAHTFSYSMGTGGSLSGDKAAMAWSWPPTSV